MYWRLEYQRARKLHRSIANERELGHIYARAQVGANPLDVGYDRPQFMMDGCCIS